MPLFFFHVCTDIGLISDPEGSDLLDLNAAKCEALAGLRELVADCLRSGKVPNSQHIEIADQAGQVLATVHVRDALNARLRRGAGLV